MISFNSIVIGCWLIFAIYWFVSSFGVKKNIRNNYRWLIIRVIMLIVVLLLFRSGFFDRLSTSYLSASAISSIKVVGVILCAAGIGFAIWARRHLGKNWGMPMSVKEKPDLVTTGPYEHVRHPIYTGVLCALLGSSVVVGLELLVPFVLFLVYFIYSAKTEEKLMLRQFPKQYPPYMKKTKMLIPFLL